MQKKPKEPPATNIQQYIFTGTSPENFPIDKQSIKDEWICQLKAGKVRFLLDMEEYEINTEAGKSIYFIIHDDFSFRILSGSSDMEMVVFSISHECITTLYPFLGGEANSLLFSQPLITSENFNDDISQMLEIGGCELQLCVNNPQLLQRDKVVLHLLIYLYLTFYNGIDIPTIHTSEQSFNIANRLYELFCDSESYKHRNAQYFAKKLNISPRYFFEVCKKETGYSPKQIIDEAITNEIRHTMLTSDLSLQQISIDFNFSDQTAFNQYFKRNVGMTPSKYRKKYK